MLLSRRRAGHSAAGKASPGSLQSVSRSCCRLVHPAALPSGNPNPAAWFVPSSSSDVRWGQAHAACGTLPEHTCVGAGGRAKQPHYTQIRNALAPAGTSSAGRQPSICLHGPPHQLAQSWQVCQPRQGGKRCRTVSCRPRVIDGQAAQLAERGRRGFEVGSQRAKVLAEADSNGAPRQLRRPRHSRRVSCGHNQLGGPHVAAHRAFQHLQVALPVQPQLLKAAAQPAAAGRGGGARRERAATCQGST